MVHLGLERRSAEFFVKVVQSVPASHFMIATTLGVVSLWRSGDVSARASAETRAPVEQDRSANTVTTSPDSAMAAMVGELNIDDRPAPVVVAPLVDTQPTQEEFEQCRSDGASAGYR